MSKRKFVQLTGTGALGTVALSGLSWAELFKYSPADKYAPKRSSIVVEMIIGQTITNVMADFEFKKYIGLTGKITDNPFRDICRSQIDIS